MKKFERSMHVMTLANFSIGKEVELITTAKQTDSRYGDFRYTENDLIEMAENFNNDIVGLEIAVDLNHDPQSIALAWIVPGSMRVARSSKMAGEHSLYCKLHKFTPDGEKLVKTGAVKYFSIEVQHKFEKFVGKVKKTFKNVIRGLALTNRPVIKDMMPTFSELINHKKDKSMNPFKIFLAQLKGQDIVSVTEKETLKKMSEELSEEEKAEVKDEIAEVEAKPSEEKKAPEGETEEEKKAREDKEAADKKAEEEKDFSEVKKELNENKAALDKALTEIRKKDMTSYSEELILSDKDKALSFGFAKTAQDKVVNFLMTLSEKQVAEFKEIWKEIKAVDFSEKGLDSEGNVKIDDKQFADAGLEVDEASAKVDAEVKALMAKDSKLTYEEAFAKVAESSK